MIGLGLGLGLTRGWGAPALDLNFLNGTMPAAGLTFTRAGGGGRINSSGLYEWVGADVPRFDYDPITLACKGLLIEESRTNLFVDSVYATRPANGAVAPGTVLGTGTISFPAGITCEKVGEGSFGSSTYVDLRFSGTASGTVLISYGSGSWHPAAVGQNFTVSSYIALVGGSLSNITSITQRIQEYAGTTFLASGGDEFVPVASLGRYKYTRSLTSATVDRVRALSSFNAAGAVDFTIRLVAAQVELGAFPTSYIPTVASAVTRAADVCLMTGADFSRWFNPTEGTIVAEFSTITNGLNNTGGNGFFWIYDIDSSGAATSSHELLVSATYGPGINARTQVAGTSQAALTTPVTLGTGSTIRYAYAYKTNDFAGSLNGGSVLVDAAGSLPPAPDRMAIGSTNGGSSSHLNGHLRRIRYYPRRLDNARLQELSA